MTYNDQYPFDSLSEEERRAHDYLRMVSGKEVADWACEHQNGTWQVALDLIAQKQA